MKLHKSKELGLWQREWLLITKINKLPKRSKQKKEKEYFLTDFYFLIIRRVLINRALLNNYIVFVEVVNFIKSLQNGGVIDLFLHKRPIYNSLSTASMVFLKRITSI